MPDGAHVGSFFAGLGKSLSSGLQRGAEQRAAEKSQADAQKSAQEDFIHQMLLSSAEHNPNLSVDDYHKILHTVLVAKGKKAGIPEDQITGLLGNLIKPVAKTFKAAPDSKEFADTVLADKMPEMRDTTMGDVQAQQAQKMTEATKLPVIKEQNAGKIAVTRQRHDDNLSAIHARGDEKAMATYKMRLADNVNSGMELEDAKTEAATYARSLSDANLGQKQAGVKRTEAQTNLAKVRADLAPKILAQRVAEANDRSSYRWKNLARLEKMTDAQLGTTGLSKAELGTVRGYMHTLDTMKGKVAGDIDKARMKAEKEGKTPEEIKAITDELFDAYTTAATAITQTAEQVLGDKIVIDPGGGWPSIGLKAQAPGGVGTSGAGKGRGTGGTGGGGVAPTSGGLITNDPRVGKQVRNKTTGAVGVVDGVTADGQLHVNWGAGH